MKEWEKAAAMPIRKLIPKRKNGASFQKLS
jgi:hypothetical protein